MEHQSKELADTLDAERADAAAKEAAAREAQAKDAAAIAGLTATVGGYKAVESSFGERLKWALKKHS